MGGGRQDQSGGGDRGTGKDDEKKPGKLLAREAPLPRLGSVVGEGDYGGSRADTGKKGEVRGRSAGQHSYTPPRWGSARPNESKCV